MIFDMPGQMLLTEHDLDLASEMYEPVRCTYCNGIYDLGTVEITGRYTDCTMWKSPCCKRTVDDRGEYGWKLRRDYVRIDTRAMRW